jgi:hypothetical protein
MVMSVMTAATSTQLGGTGRRLHGGEEALHVHTNKMYNHGFIIGTRL